MSCYVAVDALLMSGLSLSLILYTWASQNLRNIFGFQEKHISAGTWLLYPVMIVSVLVICVTNIPLPIFYILFYAICCFAQYLLKETSEEGLLLTNIRFISFAAPHLIVLGLLALVFQTDVREILNNTNFRMLSFVIVTVLSSFLAIGLTHSLSNDRLRTQGEELQELHLFAKFVWFCVGSIILDSIPCLFALPTKFAVLFLMGSNLLLLLMAFLFASHVSAIIRDAYLKEEYLCLQEEEFMQHSLTAQLEQDAYLDGLTGIYTRAYVMANINNMLKDKESFILSFLDLDGLKQINDQQGHLEGDRYLKSFAAYVKENLHPNNIFARFGGDEFLLLMPDTTMEEAAERLLELQAGATKSGHPFSFGAVLVPPDNGRGAEEWVAEADRSMYEDKKLRKTRREGVGI